MLPQVQLRLSGENPTDFKMADWSTAKIQPGKWVRGDRGEESLRRFDMWIFTYQRWIHIRFHDMDPVLTHSQKWELLIATRGGDLQQIIMEAGIVTHDNSSLGPTPLDQGIKWIWAASPRSQDVGRTNKRS